MTELIGFEKFSFKYDAQVEPTLQDISLTIKKGEKILIVGPSGSGKSTLGQVLNGIIPNIHQGQEKGVFTLGGKDAFALSIYEKSQLVSTVLQDTDGQFIGLTVAEDLAFALENDGLAQSEMKQLVADWAERLELTDLLKHRPQDLSGGQKQRVSLAGVLIDESPILLFDEPLANLDPHTGQTTIELIDQMHASLGATTIIIEHRLEDVLHRSVDRIILMVEGRIAFDGSPDQLLKTSLLAEAGIREPLYLTSLRDWGYDLTKADSLSQLDRLDLSELVISPVAKDQESPTRETLLEVRDLTVTYEPDRPIIKGLSLDLYRGELLALVGKNGAGKSTLAKALCQFMASQGQVTYQGQDISGDSIAQRAGRIGYVLQNPNQMISQSLIFDEVALGLRLRGLDEATIEERVHQALKTCGLYPFRKWPISALSYGQKKRVTIASILVLNPEIILLDEPTAGQDLRHYQEMMDFLAELSQAGHTVVMVTHDMQLMLEYADRAVVLVDGEILAEGSPSAILSDPGLVQAANLKETSLYQLAKSLGLDPLALTQDYIDRRRKSHV